MARLDQIYRDGYPITASDSADLTSRIDGLFAGVAGNVVVTTEGGHKLTFTLPAGSILPFSIVRVWSTNTTATQLIGCQYAPNYGAGYGSGLVEEDIATSIADELVDDSAVAIYDESGENIYV
jgi:hypothetical protein